MEKNPFKYTLDNKRYHTLNYYNRTNFGGKIYKASLNCGFTCPNLDGSRGTGGCIFCDGGRCACYSLFSGKHQHLCTR